MFLKENIEKKNCLIEQMTSAIYVMVYIASYREYQVLWKVKKDLVQQRNIINVCDFDDQFIPEA